MDPEWQKSMGLTAEMAKDSVGLLHTMRNWQLEAQKQTREKNESNLYSSSVNTALGVGTQKDPVRAVQMIQNSLDIDGKTKMENAPCRSEQSY